MVIMFAVPLLASILTFGHQSLFLSLGGFYQQNNMLALHASGSMVVQKFSALVKSI